MRQARGKMILEPQLTAFQVNILMECVERLHEEAARKASENPNDVASWVASMVEYDEIMKALKEERELYDDYIRPKLRGKTRA